MPITGGCLCGAVRYEADAIKAAGHACHCSMCRRWGGGPALAVDVEGLRVQDTSSLRRYASSEWAERGFCGECGGHLFYWLKPANQYLLWMGSLDDVSACELADEIFIDEKPAAYAFAGDHPRLTGAEFLAAMGETPS